MLGSNMGDRMNVLRQATDMLRKAGRIAALSPAYESEPWGFDDTRWFLNQVAVLETELSPHALLERVRQIEQALGRVRDGDGYQSRTIDIDILLYDNCVLDAPELVIPHPRMTERMFVMLPMAELAPELVHPTTLQTMAHLRARCTDEKQVFRLDCV